MTFFEIRSAWQLGIILPIAVTASSCTILNQSSTGDPVFSIMTESTSISEAEDGRLTVRFQQPKCLVSSNDISETVVTFRSGGTIKEPGTLENLLDLAGGVLRFLLGML